MCIRDRPDDTTKEFVVTGTMHNPQLPSPEITGFTVGTVTPDGMEYLGMPALFTEMHIRVTGENPDRATVQAVTDEVEQRIERSGRDILGTAIIGKSVIESIVNTAVMILSFFGWIILLLSAFLVVNTLSALITQQLNLSLIHLSEPPRPY